ncbi:hypothetical protein [Xanthomonas cassavae]|nr:hypothetical protein [Xanthomonas cassavae]
MIDNVFPHPALPSGMDPARCRTLSPQVGQASYAYQFCELARP